MVPSSWPEQSTRRAAVDGPDRRPLRSGIAVAALLILGLGLVGTSARVGWLASGRARTPDETALRDLYKRQHTARIHLSARRGDIYDCRGRRLAGSLEVPSVFADPVLIDNVGEAAGQLAPVLEMPASLIAEMIEKRKDRRFAWLARHVDEQQARAVRDLRIRGIGIQREPFRSYPAGPLASHVLGFIGADQEGLAGAELQYDKALQGRDGFKVCNKDAGGRILSLVPNGFQPPRDGCDVVLTIDSFIQSIAERALAQAVDKYEAEAGVAVVTEPSTGQVLAMAGRPTFDPNDYRHATGENLRNRALTGPVEPGSTFKPMIAAAALQEGFVRPGEVFFCHNGVYVSGSRRLRDHHGYGDLTFEEVLGKSSNIGMALIGERLGNPAMWHHLTRFGFGAKTGIDLPGEDVGILLPLAKWTRYSTHSIPMGQEIAVTPIQLITAFNTVINGGTWVQPTITRGVIAPDGRLVVDNRQPHNTRRVLEARVAEYMTETVLTGVVNDGTGWPARLGRWQVVGKTGTAQMARRDGRGYEPDAYIGSFICGAPARDPRVSVLVMIYRPNRRLGYYGGTVAAPAAATILGASLDYLNIPDDPVPPPRAGTALVSGHD